MQFAFVDQLAVNAQQFPGRVAIEVLAASGGEGPTLTYADVWRRIVSLAGAIGEVAPGPNGPMVAMLLPNGVDAILTYLACQVVGAAAVPVNTRLALPEIDYVMSDSGASVLVCAGELLANGRAAAANAGARLLDADRVPTMDVADLGGRAIPPMADAPAVIGYTSGTTGFPKGVINTGEGWWLMALRMFGQLNLTSDQVMLTAGPICHMSYATMSLGALLIGARVRVMVAFDAERASAELDGPCTWAFLVPSMTTMMLEHAKRHGGQPLRSARFILSSGASLPSSVLEGALDLFPNAAFAEGYGWSEAYGFCNFEIKDRATLRPHSVGWSAMGFQVRVLDEDGRVCPVGEAGQVASRTLTPFAGYLNRPDATAAALRDGFILSGDIGILDEDGRLRIVDRKPDMIVSGGENVYSAEVERVLVEHPGVLEAAVVGRPHELWGEAVVGVVVRASDALDPDELRAFCRERLAGYKCPKDIVILDDPADLPRNPMGKIQKFRVRKEVVEPRFTPAASANP